MSTYKGRVALLTGASGGIGNAIIKVLAKEGVNVVATGRRVDKIQAVADTLKGEPGLVIPKKLDVTKPEEIEALFKTIEKELGGVDVLINNAGILQFKPIHELSNEEIKFVQDVNQTSVFVASREAMKGWLNRKVNDGFIINVSSVSGVMVPWLPGLSPGVYAPTKHAVTAGCKQLRYDLKNAGLKCRVSCVCPGAVETDMTVALRQPGINFLQPEDIANTIAFILSMPKTAEITEVVIQPTNETY